MFRYHQRVAKNTEAKGKGCVPGTCLDKKVKLFAAFFSLPRRLFLRDGVSLPRFEVRSET